MGNASIRASSPVKTTEEVLVNVDEVISTVVNTISQETADQVLSPDVRPDAATSGTSEKPNSENPIDEVVDEPISDQPDDEINESEKKGSAEVEENGTSEPSNDGDDATQ